LSYPTELSNNPVIILSDNCRVGKQTLSLRRFPAHKPGLLIAGCADTMLLSE
jgi:hypothetical protein